MTTRQPNILWYCTDQQLFDTIGALGNPHVRGLERNNRPKLKLLC